MSANASKKDTPHSSVASLRESAGPCLKDLAGMDEARAWGEQLARDLALYKEAKIPWSDVDPGVLLYGKPGTGKTTFAKALAATCDVPIIATSYSRWQQAGDGHLGDVLQAMAVDFKEAAYQAPAILFIDELDSVSRKGGSGRKSDSWYTGIINALLELIDGADGRVGVVIVGATNHVDNIDPALLRAGRFDRRIEIPMPSPDALAGILRYHLKGQLPPRANLKRVAILCTGMSGADIAQLARDARKIARNKKRALRLADLVTVLDANSDATPEALHRIAIHEAGHAVAAIEHGIADNVTVSLFRSASMGGRTNFGEMRQILMTREALISIIVVSLAGRAAEEVLFGQPSAGAGGTEVSDLANATRIATNIVTSYGLAESNSLIWYGQHERDNPVLFDPKIADQVNDILNAAHAQAKDLVRRHEPAIRAIAEALVRKRALTHTDILACLVKPGRVRLVP